MTTVPAAATTQRPAFRLDWFERQGADSGAGTESTGTGTGGDEFVIPEDLSELSEEQVRELHSQAVQNFDALYGDGTGLSDADVELLAGLTEGIEALASRLAELDEAGASRAATAAELLSRVRPAENAEEAEADHEGDDEKDGEDAESEDGEKPAEGEGDGDGEESDGAAQVRTAAAARRSVRVPLSALRNRAAAAANTPRTAAAPTSPRDVMVAAGDGLGQAVGAGVDYADAGRMLSRRLNGFNRSAYDSAHRAGRPLAERHSLVAIQRNFPEDLQVRHNDPDHVREVFDRAGDETRLPGGSLVAAGGWCAPSEVNYAILNEVETREGMLSIPEIGVPRGGLSFTTGLNFADLYFDVATGHFSFTETQAEAGQYARAVPGLRAVSTAQALGSFRRLTDGSILKAVVAGTTSAGAEPATPPLYGTVVDGTVTWQHVAYNETNAAGDKPCIGISCPPFVEYRLDVDGLCVTADILETRGYPEVLARTLRGLMIAHEHLMNKKMIDQIAALSTSVTMPAGQIGAAAPLLTAIELQVEHYKASRRMARNTSLEMVAPFWLLGAIRHDLARRQGVDMIGVSNARIQAWFAQLGVAVQFVYNWQPIDIQTAANFTTWPGAVDFLLYEAGTWIRGASDVITLDTIYDAAGLAQNQYSALFTEEGWFTALRGQDSRRVTVPLDFPGATAATMAIDWDGTLV